MRVMFNLVARAVVTMELGLTIVFVALQGNEADYDSTQIKYFSPDFTSAIDSVVTVACQLQ